MNDSAELPPDPFAFVEYAVKPGTPEATLRKSATSLRRAITTARRARGAADLMAERFPWMATSPKTKGLAAELEELLVELEAQHVAVQLECLDRGIRLPRWRGDR